MARPWVAALVRLFVVIIPAVTGGLAAWGMAGLLPEASGGPAVVGWWAALIVAAVLAILATQRFARRLLPLSWLLTLTLSFPDKAPSRLLTARRAAKRRSRHEAVSSVGREGLGDDPQAAAAQALVLVTALGEHDRRTRGHSERVRGFADVLAEEAGVSAEDRDRLRWGALLHDIGKLSVPGAILNKPGRPNEDEWATLQRHPAEGGRLVEPLNAWLGPWSGAIAQHHERWDGSGYPNGLAGEEISLGGRILSVADAYEVMTANRAYKQAMRPDEARRALVADAGTHFDPELVRYFLNVSLGRLWWIIGGSAFLSLFPWLAKLWATPAGASARNGASGPVTAVAAVAGLALAGVVGPTGRLLTAAGPAPPAAGAAAHAPPVGSSGGGTPAHPAIDIPGVVPVEARAGLSGLAPRPVTQLSVTRPAAPPSGATTTTTTTTMASPPVASPPPDDPLAPPTRYSAQGRLVAPALLGLTEASLAAECGPSGPVGLDAVVFELPGVNRVAGAPVMANGQDLLGVHDLVVTFYSANCDELDRLDQPGQDAAGSLPAGTVFVGVSDRSGLATSVDLTVG